MTIRLAEKRDLDKIMLIIADARESIGRLGIDQWQYGYPTRDSVKEDISMHHTYVALDGEDICATFALTLSGEPTYKKIYCGAWMCNEEYVTVHKIAIDTAHRGSGAASEIMNFIVEYAKNNGYASVRIDTHHGNIPMRKMLEKNGFEHCGNIYLLDGQPRVAYERLV